MDIDLDDDRYNEGHSGSKANRLRALWDLEPDAVVGRVVEASIEHRGHRPEARPWDDDGPEAPNQKADLVERCSSSLGGMSTTCEA